MDRRTAFQQASVSWSRQAKSSLLIKTPKRETLSEPTRKERRRHCERRKKRD